MSKASNKVLAVAGTSVMAAILFAAAVLSYDTPNYSSLEMKEARYDLICAENRYWMAHADAVEESYDTLLVDKQYNKLCDQLSQVNAATDSVWTNPDAEWNQYMRLLEQSRVLDEQCDSLAGELRSAHISNNIGLKYATENLHRASERIERMKRDSVRTDSIAQIPVKVRFQDNWKKIRAKYHLNRIASHQKRLNEMQH